MGAAILFPRFLRKLQHIWRSEEKQNGCPMPPLSYIQASSTRSMLLLAHALDCLGWNKNVQEYQPYIGQNWAKVWRGSVGNTPSKYLPVVRAVDRLKIWIYFKSSIFSNAAPCLVGSQLLQRSQNLLIITAKYPGCLAARLAVGVAVCLPAERLPACYRGRATTAITTTRLK